MLDRESAQRPAQVNACFEGGSDRAREIVAALERVGLRGEQITVIDRTDPEKTEVDTRPEPSFADRLKSLFGGGDHDRSEVEPDYDTIIMAHLGHDDSLAGPVQEVFQQFGAARVNYYPTADVEMHVLGGADPQLGTSLTTPNANTAVGAPVPTNADPSTAARQTYPGEAPPETTTERGLDRMQPGLAGGYPSVTPLVPPNDLLAVETPEGERPEDVGRDPNVLEPPNEAPSVAGDREMSASAGQVRPAVPDEEPRPTGERRRIVVRPERRPE